MENTNLIKCPKCGSTQITANKKGFSGKKAVAGAILTGGVGLLAGTIGSNKVKITCLACGNEWKPGQDLSKSNNKNSVLLEIDNSRKTFLKLYSEGKFDEAMAALNPNDPDYSKYVDAESTFKAINERKRITTIGCLIVIAIIIISYILLKS